jgi:hypothetical protein
MMIKQRKLNMENLQEPILILGRRPLRVKETQGKRFQMQEEREGAGRE